MKLSILKYKPIILIQIYLLLIIILFAFGPWPWPIKNPFLLYSYLIISQLFLLLGYIRGINNKVTNVPLNKHYDTYKIIRLSAIVSLIMLPPTFLAYTNSFDLSFSKIAYNFINGFLNPGDQYYEKMEITRSTARTVIIFLVSIPAAFVWLYIPLTLTFWKKIKIKYKILLFFLFTFNILLWMSIGTNKGIFDLVIILFSVNFILNSFKKKKYPTRISNYLKAIILFIFISFALSYFLTTMKSRMGGISPYELTIGIKVNSDSFFLKYSPQLFHELIIMLSNYLSQGYYGLSLAMQLPFEFCFGVGNSNFLQLAVGRLFDLPISQMSYPGRIEKVFNWTQFGKWHSFYSWWASDVSFFGVPILLYFLGKLFAKVWIDIIFFKNPYAIGLFTLLTLLFLYVPANNQVFAFPGTFCAFWGLVFLWKKNIH